MMTNDTNPAVLFLSYGTPKGQQEFIDECKKRKLGIRELRFFDVEVPMERYDETVNWFKSVSMLISQRLVEAVTHNPFIKPFIKRIEDKTGYKLVDLSEMDWIGDYKVRGRYACVTPVAVEHREGYRKNLTEKKDFENYDNLYKFKSKGFKNKSLKEQGIVKEEDMTMLKEDV